MADPTRPDPIHPLLERAKNIAGGRASIYGPNANGERAAFILPDGDKHSFTPDAGGVNVNGGYTARLIYQVEAGSDPTSYGNSRVGAWLSTNWGALAGTPVAKASHYSWYFTGKGGLSDPDYPQEVSILVAKGVLAAGAEHGKVETRIAVAAHERVAATGDDAFAILTEAGDVLDTEAADSLYDESTAGVYEFVAGKLVVDQQVLVFDGPTVGVDYDPEDDDDDDGAGEPGDNLEASTPRSLYPGYGTAWNNAGLSPGFAAGIAKARKASAGGVPWLHAFYVSKRGVSGYAFRYQRYFGVTAHDLNGNLMPYMGLGTDQPETPVHVKGAVTLEHRQEYTGDASAAYELGGFSFYGKSTVGVATYQMGAIRVDVTDPTRGTECATLTLAARQAGVELDVVHVGRGLYMDGLDDQGPGTINLSGLFVDNVLVLGTDPDAADPVIPVSVRQTGKGIVIKLTGPDDHKYRGFQLYREGDDDPGVLDTLDFKSSRRNLPAKILDTPEDLTPGVTYTYYAASYSKFDVLSTVKTALGSAVWSIDALPAGQTIETAGGGATTVARSTIRLAVTDGTAVTYQDFGDLPGVDFINQNLPALPAGQNYVFLPDSLTSTGFTTSLKIETAPGAINPEDTGAGSVDATVPHPGVTHTGYSVTNASVNPAYNLVWNFRASATFSVYPITKFGRASIGLYGYDGTWHRLASPDVSASTAGGVTETVTATFSADIDPSLYSKFGIGVVSLGDGTADCTINALTWIRWKSQTPGSLTTATPNGEQITCYVNPPS